ncbi:DUF2202 domain-containing protein [Synechococcus sp. CS-602]|nr:MULTISPECIES: DUF2202 domain-containing protein [Synechococcaceae]MCT4363295.1 DUF2202 domain-containing protein [Candidatus Regnicoccus frigidus MAG-AL1]MCT0202015.1 DUF2202 domain-containing protein [Synechococcus sp. CS-603]MCT0205021.1 DUF2202 domain-containing protein [Synechococcus sp. CS-602]MCT0246225.1 DUF2202 domain-containing protein [Synechococcus sp. CS-601]MCT4367501.1 DUF2202 domain-containing protein [Candidatus Regnicoccus frigidus MAG-AL2]
MTSLTDAEIQALHDALNDEYHAWATYTQVLEDFGPVRPFQHIRDSEQRHIQALQHLFHRYNLTVPTNPWSAVNLSHYASAQEACEAGVQAEIDNVDLYQRILRATQRPEMLRVFERLRSASQNRHLAAFQRAAARFNFNTNPVAAQVNNACPGGGGGGRRGRGHCGRQRHGRMPLIPEQ